jgi:aldose 1-epimerase
MPPPEVRPASLLPSGEQYTLRLGDQQAIVTEVGAGLRSYAVAGREYLDTFAADQMCSSGRGQVLLPWPNRIDRGRYTFAGQTYQLPLSEPDPGNAIHGLTRWLNWLPVEQTPSRVALGLLLHPQVGYPFLLALEVAYMLSAQGLEARATARNVGPAPLAFGAGQHPYFTLGVAPVDSLRLRLPATTYLPTNERGIPTGRAPVAGTPLDYRAERPIGPAALDTCFTDLAADADGLVRVHLAHPSGAPRLTLTLDPAHTFVQVYTGDTIGDLTARRRGLAVEPMTCAPNAFNSGDGLRVLAPGESFTAAWRVSVA